MNERTSTLSGRNILLAVTAGVAAYKAVDLAGRMTKAGATVRTVLTKNTLRFVTALSFESVTRQPALVDMWKAPEDYRFGHIALADTAQLVVVAPATADVIAKIAHGICDDLLTTTLCTCSHLPTLLAPAMNTRMYQSPAVQDNLALLRKRGLQIIGPESGRLACGDHGPGRMSEPADILAQLETIAKHG